MLVASNERARSVLGWEPQLSELPMILETAWRWHRGNPNGYSSDRASASEERKSTELFGDVSTDVTEGRVVLTGSVPRREDKITATKLAWETEGVLAVTDELTVAGDSGAVAYAD